MSSTTISQRLRAALALWRAFESARRPARSRLAPERVSRPAVEVTSDFGVAPTFPGFR